MDLVGEVCERLMQKRTFSLFFFCGTKLNVSIFHYCWHPAVVFACKRGLHYSIMKQLNINILNFECLSKQLSEGTVSVTQFQMPRLRNHFISLHNRSDKKGSWTLHWILFYCDLEIISSWQQRFEDIISTLTGQFTCSFVKRAISQQTVRWGRGNEAVLRLARKSRPNTLG